MLDRVPNNGPERGNLSCLFEESRVQGFRKVERQISPSRQEARFYTKRGDRVIDFGLLTFREEQLTCSISDDAEFNFRIATKVDELYGNFPLTILIPGLSGKWTDQVLLQYVLLTEGFTTVYFDSRGTGENKHLTRTFGYLEAGDVTKVIHFLKNSHDDLFAFSKVGVFGACLGATAALRSATITADINAIAVEGTYAEANDAISRLVPEQLTEIETIRRALEITDSDVSPIFFAPRFPHIPLQMLWGQFDPIVPSSQRQKLIHEYEKRAAKLDYEFVEHGSHVVQFGFPLEDEEVRMYLTRISRFFRRNLAVPPSEISNPIPTVR